MNHEIEQLQRAKMFMDYLANGVDPVSNTDADASTLQSEQVIACFPYISDVLERNIYAAGNSTKHRNADCFITVKQCADLNVYFCRIFSGVILLPFTGRNCTIA